MDVQRAAEFVRHFVICLVRFPSSSGLITFDCEGRLTEIVRDKIKSLGVVGDLVVEAGEVESVEDVILFDFAKVFVPFGR